MTDAKQDATPNSFLCPRTAAICYDPRGICKPGYCRNQFHPSKPDAKPKQETAPTPRTDAQNKAADEAFDVAGLVPANFARQLERELSQAHADLAAANARIATGEQLHESVCRQLAAERTAREESERKLRVADLKNASSLANNLCPDHRDKQTFKPCLACTIETLERRLASAIEDVAKLAQRC